MKKITIILLSLMIGISTFAQDLSLNEILNHYYETMGLKNLVKKKTVIFKGKSIMQGMETPFTIYRVRPDKFRLEVPIQGQTMLQVYNSGNAWMVAPWTGTTEAKDLTGAQLKQMKKQNDIEGPLYNYKEKGNKVKLLDKEDMEGSEVYKIKLTEKDGDITNYYIDAENFVVLKTASTVKVRGEEVESDTYYSDFKPVGNVLMPFSIEVKFNGNTRQSMMMDTVIFNQKIDTNLFVKPAPKPQTPVEKK